ncbi:MAG: hypothetical protein AAB664_02680 [Patescibacteria group bacterium]
MKPRILFSSLALLLIPGSLYAAAVSPATLDLQASQGETVTSAFTIINTSASEQKYYLDTLGFKPQDESGTPQFVEKEQGDAFTKWIQFKTDQISVPAHAKVEVPFEVIVPQDVATGSHQAALTVSSAPSDIVATNGATIEAKTAILVFLHIKGETIKQAHLLDFIDAIKEKVRTELYGNFSYRIQNQGNVYVIPVGNVTFKDVFGRTLMTEDANSVKGRILPNSTRKFNVSLGKHSENIFETLRNQMKLLAIGPVTENLSIEFGEGFKQIQEVKTFWYVPYHLIATLLSAILLLFLLYRSIGKQFSKNS